MRIAQLAAVPPKAATHERGAAPPATAAHILYAAQRPDLDELIAVGLSLHLFTEIVHGRVDLSVTDLHRATTVLTKQLLGALIQHGQRDPLRDVLQLVTDGDREAMPDGRSAEDLCGLDWPAVRNAAT